MFSVRMKLELINTSQIFYNTEVSFVLGAGVADLGTIAPRGRRPNYWNAAREPGTHAAGSPPAPRLPPRSLPTRSKLTRAFVANTILFSLKSLKLNIEFHKTVETI